MEEHEVGLIRARYYEGRVIYTADWDRGVPWDIRNNEVDIEALIREEREKRSRHLEWVMSGQPEESGASDSGKKRQERESNDAND